MKLLNILVWSFNALSSLAISLCLWIKFSSPAKPFGKKRLCISPNLGTGLWPTCDWNGKPFSEKHYPKWYQLGRTELCGGWRGVLDGVQGDQDFLHKLFRFQRRWECTVGRRDISWQIIIIKNESMNINHFGLVCMWCLFCFMSKWYSGYMWLIVKCDGASRLVVFTSRVSTWPQDHGMLLAGIRATTAMQWHGYPLGRTKHCCGLPMVRMQPIELRPFTIVSISRHQFILPENNGPD